MINDLVFGEYWNLELGVLCCYLIFSVTTVSTASIKPIMMKC